MSDTELPLSYYKTLIEYSVDVMTVMEIDGKITYESPSVMTVFGYTPEEMVGKNALSYIHPLDLPHALSVIAEAKIHPEKRYLVEIRYKHKNGSWIWIECNARFFPGIGIDAAVIHSRDVTDRKERTDTILKLQKAVEATNEAIFITDVNDTIIYVNPAFLALYGYSAEELLGKAASEFFKMIQTPEQQFEETKERLHTKHLVKIEVAQKTKTGAVITVEGTLNPILDDHGNIVGFVGTQHNISDRKSLESELAEGAKSLEMYKLAVEHATNHIVITDVDGKILFANKGVERITGFTNGEVIGQTPRLWGKQMDREFYEKFWHVIKDERQAFVGEVRNKRKNGELYWAMAAVSPIVNNDQLVGFIGVEEDITQNKQIISELEEIKERFEAFMQKSPSLAWMKDSEFRRIYVNATYCDFFHVTPEEIKKKTDYDQFPKDVADVLRADDLKVIKAGRPMEFEEWTVAPDGVKHLWQVYKFPFKDKQGRQLVGGLATDITERKKAEQALRERTEDLEKMNSLMVGREVKMSELKDQLSKAMAELEALKNNPPK